MAYEPHGHRGHPSHSEQSLAHVTRLRIEECVDRLMEEGFDHHEEILTFIAGIAHEIARERGETWTSVGGAKRTVTDIYENERAGKFWSLVAINAALNEIERL